MKGTEKIIAHIKADASAQADAILAQSERQCAEIRQSYEARAKERYGEKIRQGVKTCQDNIDSVERINQMEAKKSILALKQEMESRSFDLACQMLSAFLKISMQSCLQSWQPGPPTPPMRKLSSTPETGPP